MPRRHRNLSAHATAWTGHIDGEVESSSDPRNSHVQQPLPPPPLKMQQATEQPKVNLLPEIRSFYGVVNALSAAQKAENDAETK